MDRKALRKPPEHLASLAPHYRIYQTGAGKYELECRRCTVMYALPLENRHPGNVLKMLDHARGHPPKQPRGGVEGISSLLRVKP